MITLTNNDKKIGTVSPYSDNIKRIRLFACDNFNILTTVGYTISLTLDKDLDNSLKEYLDFIKSQENNDLLNQNVLYLKQNRNFDLGETSDIESLMDIAIIRNEIDALLVDYSALPHLSETEEKDLREYLNKQSSYLVEKVEEYNSKNKFTR